METAHFFWHGRPLSIYENACLASFVRHGFRVNLWSYKPLEAPKGAVLCDASEILPAGDLQKYNQDGRPGSLAAFTDSFRFHLLNKHEGWWFDADILCLSDCANFTAVRQGKPIVCGIEENSTINGAVLYLADKALIGEFLAELDRSGVTGPWGFMGPDLLTRVLKRLGLSHLAMPQHVFYPIHWSLFQAALQPRRAEEAAQFCANSLTHHIWNDYLARLSIPKNIMPPEGSYLHDQIVKNCPEYRSIAALPVETLNALISGYILLQETDQFIKSVQNRTTWIRRSDRPL